MRQVIHIEVGETGKQMGRCFWRSIFEQHTFTKQNPKVSVLQHPQTYFDIDKNGNQSARCITIGQEQVNSGVLVLKHQNTLQIKGLEERVGEPFILGQLSTEKILNTLRKQSQKCQSFESFQFIYSLDEVDCKIASIILEMIKDTFPNSISSCFSLFSSSQRPTSPQQVHYTVDSLRYLTEFSDLCFPVDRCSKLVEYKKFVNQVNGPAEEILGNIFGRLMSDSTCLSRFENKEIGFRKLAMNLVPFPKLHYIVAGMGPTTSSPYAEQRSIKQLFSQAICDTNLSCFTNMRHGLNLSQFSVLRGGLFDKQIEEFSSRICGKYWCYFVDWIPHNFMREYCLQPPPSLRASAGIFSNTTSICQVFDKLSSAETLFGKKYSTEEHNNAIESLNQLIDQYKTVKKYRAEEDYGDYGEESEG